MPGFPVLHHLLELAQTHIHWVGDALHPSHPMSSPSFCLHSFPVSGSFLRSQFFASCGQSIGASALASVFPMNIQDWFPLGLTGLISLLPSSFQFSRSIVSDSLWNHELQHARPPCPSQTPGVYPNSCPVSWWCHPAISSSLVPFFSCPQSLPASGSFPMNQLFAWGGQSIGVSASASVLPMNTQDWSPLGWNSWISLQSKGLSSLLQRHSSKASIFHCSAFFTVQLSHSYMTTGKTIALTN